MTNSPKAQLDLLNESNSTNYKINTLKTMKSDDFLRRIFKLAYDKISFTYGVSGKRYVSDEFISEMENHGTMKLSDALDMLEQSLAKRNVTGNEAINSVEKAISGLSRDDAQIFINVLNRDLKINMGTTNIMKIWPDLIDTPAYMRCETYGPKTKKHIKFPAILQVKADGTYREARVDSNGDSSFVSRSGISYDYPLLEEVMSHFPPGSHVMGELTVKGAENRSIGNGLLNSDDVPHDKIVFEVWDIVTAEEYENARLSKKLDKKLRKENTTKYRDRLKRLEEIISKLPDEMGNRIRVIEGVIVNDLKEATDKVAEFMSRGLEGGVLKDLEGVFSNTTSKHQQKMKLAFSVEVRVTGFQEGNPGTKRVKTFGAMLFETDDGKIKGKTSGFKDDLLEEINADREGWIGAVIEVEANDLTKGRDSDHYALSHPRFKTRRDDRKDTDTLERAMKSLEMAKMFS